MPILCKTGSIIKPLNRLIRMLKVELILLMMIAACAKPAPQRAQIVPVEVATVQQVDVPLNIQAIGTVEPIQSVPVRSQAGGYLSEVYFQEGQDVEAGKLLFQIDARSLNAIAMQMKATLEQTRVQSINAQDQFHRYEELYKKNFISKGEYDQVRTTAEALEAAVKAQEASLEKASLDRQFATIRAPISGRAGILQVHKGDLIKANDTILITLNQLRPINIKFAIPEKDLSAVRAAWEEENVPVNAVLSKDGGKSVKGRLIFVDNTVDVHTGSILLKAQFENDDEILWPGQFMDVVVVLKTLKNALVIPSQAIQTGQQGTYVFVVDSNKKAEMRKIIPGQIQDELTVIKEGLKSGETVVTDGQVRLVSGAMVEFRGGKTEKGQDKAL